MLILKNLSILGEEKLSILIGGEKIILIEKTINLNSKKAETIDCDGLMAFPGLVDPHIHLAGAGGEGGPLTRTPEIDLQDLLFSGITCAIGSLGADGFTRSVKNLLYKVRQLNQAGLSCYLLTGSYQPPFPSITGDVFEDIILIPEVLGIGEVAISDHRSSEPSEEELYKIVSRARLAGMISNKCGSVVFHMGDEPEMFKKIENIVVQSNYKFSNILATHCNRNPEIFEESKRVGKILNIDITTSSYEYFKEVETKPSKAVKELIKAGVPPEKITLSSDAGGSLPDFDEKGNLKKIFYAKPSSLLSEFKDLVLKENLNPNQAIKFVSTNSASFFKLPLKGKIEENYDADIILLDEKFNLHSLIARGKFMVYKKKIVS